MISAGGSSSGGGGGGLAPRRGCQRSLRWQGRGPRFPWLAETARQPSPRAPPPSPVAAPAPPHPPPPRPAGTYLVGPVVRSAVGRGGATTRTHPAAAAAQPPPALPSASAGGGRWGGGAAACPRRWLPFRVCHPRPTPVASAAPSAVSAAGAIAADAAAPGHPPTRPPARPPAWGGVAGGAGVGGVAGLVKGALVAVRCTDGAGACVRAATDSPLPRRRPPTPTRVRARRRPGGGWPRPISPGLCLARGPAASVSRSPHPPPCSPSLTGRAVSCVLWPSLPASSRRCDAAAAVCVGGGQGGGLCRPPRVGSGHGGRPRWGHAAALVTVGCVRGGRAPAGAAPSFSSAAVPPRTPLPRRRCWWWWRWWRWRLRRWRLGGRCGGPVGGGPATRPSRVGVVGGGLPPHRVGCRGAVPGSVPAAPPANHCHRRGVAPRVCGRVCASPAQAHRR